MLSQKKKLVKSGTDIKNFYTLITLPSHLRGYVKYVVVLLPLNGCTYSLGIKYICQSEGARELLQRLDEQRDRKHKKPLHAFLCSSAATGTICPFGWSCTEIHCTMEGFRAKRTWDRPVKAIRSLKPNAGDNSCPIGPQGILSGSPRPSLGSDQGTEEALTENESILSEEYGELCLNDERVAISSNENTLLCNIPMTQEQRELGYTAHNPYCPFPTAEGSTQGKQAFSTNFRRWSSWDEQFLRQPTSEPNRQLQRTISAAESSMIPSHLLPSQLCYRQGCPCLYPQHRNPFLTPLAASGAHCSPTVPSSSLHLKESALPLLREQIINSAIAKCHPGNFRNVDDQATLKQSLRRMREKARESDAYACDVSSAPVDSKRKVNLTLIPKPTDLQEPTTACSSASSGRSWADEVEDACEMDFTCPLMGDVSVSYTEQCA